MLIQLYLGTGILVETIVVVDIFMVFSLNCHDSVVDAIVESLNTVSLH